MEFAKRLYRTPNKEKRMGNLESNPVRNRDKRTSRREYRENFIACIKRYRAEAKKQQQQENNAVASATAVSSTAASDDMEWSQNVRVAVRKRPIFRHEVEDFEFDVVTVTRAGRSAVVHDARMHPDMKRMFMHHHEFAFDHVFDEKVSNDHVYASAVAPLVKHAAVSDGFCTALVYGQTGSGKTFTMSSIYQQAAEDIFAQLDAHTDRFAPQPPTVSLSFVELRGDMCHDLLNSFHKVDLLSAPDGSVHAFPVVEPTVASPDELYALIQYACGCRATAATGVHDASSRTHAILRIYIQRAGPVPHTTTEGVLTLVDLAGSEHRIDSMYHNADRRKEGANINASLMALKDCIRARAAGKNASHQYRKSKLTMALKSSFLLPSSRTLVIATVSPSSKDTEHSLNTLRHACLMDGQDAATAAAGTAAAALAGASGGEHPGNVETRFLTGGSVVKEEVGEINVAEISRKNMALKKAGGTIDSKTSNGNVNSGGGPADGSAPETSEKDKARMRRAAERKAMARLTPEQRAPLLQARGELGQDLKQQERLRRSPPATDDDDAFGDAADPRHMHESDPVLPRYGGILAVARSPESKSVRARDATAHTHSSETTEPARPSFQKLRASVFSAQGAVPDKLLRRQLKTLMKLNGYEVQEIDALVPPSPAEKLLSKLQQSPREAAGEESAPGNVRQRSRMAALDEPPRPAHDGAGSGKGVAGQKPLPSRHAQAASENPAASPRPGSAQQRPRGRGAADPGKDKAAELDRVRAEALAAAAVEEQAQLRQNRQERARAVRTKLEQDKKAAILARMPKSAAAALSGGSGGLQKVEEQVATADVPAYEPAYEPSDFSARVNVHRAEIERLEAELLSAESGHTQLSAGAMHGLKRQLQSHRAVLLRERRHVERTSSSAAGVEERNDAAAECQGRDEPPPAEEAAAMVSSASAPALATAGDDAAPADLDVYRRAMGYSAVARSPLADDVPDPTRLSHVKAACRARRPRPRDIYAAAASSALDASSGGRHQDRPAWQDVVEPAAARRDAFEDDNQHFIGLGAQYPLPEPLPASPVSTQQPQFQLSSPPLAPAERHFYGKRQDTRYLGAAAAPFSNELTYNRSPDIYN